MFMAARPGGGILNNSANSLLAIMFTLFIGGCATTDIQTSKGCVEDVLAVTVTRIDEKTIGFSS